MGEFMERISIGARLCARGFCATSALAIAASWASVAMAQDAPAASQEATESDDARDREIIVTGSRLARGGFNAPNPVTVLNAEDIEKLGIVNTSDVVAQLPQNSQFT